jgi:iron complex outermembrane recepter protein
LNLIEVILAQGSLYKSWRGFSTCPLCTLTCYDACNTVMTSKYLSNKPVVQVFIAQAAIIFIANNSWAQTNTPATPTAGSATQADAKLPAVTIAQPKASNAMQAEVTAVGDAPLQRTPISAAVITATQMQAVGAKRLADVIQLDASASDAYNATGYWDYATVRGFVLDNKFNYRRDGLPISAETYLSIDNKERIEILKGTSGMQAGTSAPGGLINYVVKRPLTTAQPLRTIKIEAASAGNISTAADLAGRFGTDNALGYRLNLAADKLNTRAPNTQGSSQLAALAMDWRIGKDSLLEAEVEYSQRSQPSVPGLSLLGNALPAADARVNINNQAWSQPVVLQGTTASLRFEQALSSQWRWAAHWASQQLKSDDRAAFPFGCTAAFSYNTYCPNGDADLYDYRSDGERRNSQAMQLQLKGKFATGPAQHDLALALLRSSLRERGNTFAYNPIGTVNTLTPTQLPADPTPTQAYTQRDNTSTELSVSDAISWGSQWTTWLGLRHTQLSRAASSVNAQTSYSQSINTPWAAVGYQLNPATLVYVSHGHGIESRVVPNLPAYGAQAGQPLATLRSRQTELGVKSAQGDTQWSLAWFNITRPLVSDTGSSVSFDGVQRHSGLEASAQTQLGPWQLGGSASIIRARQQDATINTALNSEQPTNVPNAVARLNAAYRFAALPRLAANAALSHEGTRRVLPNGSVTLPAWTRLDAGLAYTHRAAGTQLTWNLGIDNLLNRQFLKESPTQFGHVYLFPQQPRTARLGLTLSL